MSTPRVLAFAGSHRKGSWNGRLVEVAATGAQQAGAQVTLVNLADYPLPLYDQDLEAETGLPEPGRRLRELFLSHDGLMIASPEYNSSLTPLLKNTIDWMSRPQPGEPALKAFTGKVAVLMSASPGALGGLRGLVHVRSILGNIGVIVLPQQIAIPKATEAFDEHSLRDAKQRESVENLGCTLAEFLRRLSP